jgi:hypothetical protein
MAIRDRYDSDLMLTHSQATNVNHESKDYQEGYSDGYWQQPEKQPNNPEYMAGYNRGYNNVSLDGN